MTTFDQRMSIIRDKSFPFHREFQAGPNFFQCKKKKGKEKKTHSEAFARGLDIIAVFDPEISSKGTTKVPHKGQIFDKVAQQTETETTRKTPLLYLI